MIIIAIILIIIGFLNLIYGILEPEYKAVILGIILTVVGCILLSTNYNYLNNSEPTALDVYRGKTILEITYRDSIPVDSVVVFKDNTK